MQNAAARNRVNNRSKGAISMTEYVQYLVCRARWLGASVVGLCLLLPLAAGAASAPRQPCTTDGRVLNVGFYAHFAPVSYSADSDPNVPGFNTHRGYEADLLSALEALNGAGLVFSRRGIGNWDGIWIRPAEPDFDIVGGGITILDSRTRDATGKTKIVFTSGHIAFRQSLLVRAEDAARFATHGDLTAAARVGVLPGSTGEFRLLQLTGLTDEAGVLATGTRVDAPNGPVVADGSTTYVIGPAGVSASLKDRQRLIPPRTRYRG